MKKLIVPITLFAVFLAVSCGNKKNEAKALKMDSVSKTGKPDTSKSISMKPSIPPLTVKIDSIAETSDFKVVAPKGWSQKENILNDHKMLFLVAPETGNFKSNLNILKDRITGKDIDEYVNNNLKKMAAMQVKRTGESNIHINGITGKSISYLYDYQGSNLSIKTYVLPVDTVVYIY